MPAPLPVAGGQTGGRPALALRQHSARPAVGWRVATSMPTASHTSHAMTGSKSDITFRPLPGDDPHGRKPDIKLVRMHLGWKPQVGLGTGLDKTIRYFRTIMRTD